MRKSVFLVSILLMMAATFATAAETLTYSDIVARLYDVKRLTTPPVEGEQSGCFSSWDRGAKYDEKSGKYVNWHANSDGGGYMDNKGTMMKLDGPGVIWRIWSARPGDGALEFSVDQDPPPVTDETPFRSAPLASPFKMMFQSKPFTDYPELVHVKAKGHNFFVPIPFQKSIEIRAARGWGQYYQITYTKFPKGTKVPSFTGKYSDEDKAALKKANDIWAKRGPQMFVAEGAEAVTEKITLKPGKTVRLAKFKKKGAITSITMDRPEMDPPFDSAQGRKASIKILRDLTISISWDGEKKPSVWSPLGDFFGTGAGENLYKSMMTGMTEKKYYANWYMPYAKAEIEIRNDGAEERELTFTIHTEKLGSEVKKLLRYHCKWHRDDFSGFNKEQLMDERWPDWPVLKVDGTAGRFCGFQAHMWNPNHTWSKEGKTKFTKPLPEGDAFKPGGRLHRFYGGVAGGYWWGEGDEKFFVDGEKMPSTFGTGSEDYFGYAWGTAQAYDSALQVQPRNGAADKIGKGANRAGPGNIGHITMARWQVADNIPFQKSFEAVIEKYHPNNWPLLNAYAASWYQTPGTEDYYGAVPAEERSGYFVPATLKTKKSEE